MDIYNEAARYLAGVRDEQEYDRKTNSAFMIVTGGSIGYFLGYPLAGCFLGCLLGVQDYHQHPVKPIAERDIQKWIDESGLREIYQNALTAEANSGSREAKERIEFERSYNEGLLIAAREAGLRAAQESGLIAAREAELGAAQVGGLRQRNITPAFMRQ
ncbi:MAG: hypothetical protein ACPG5T_03215 [Endozoicomonas sp.]